MEKREGDLKVLSQADGRGARREESERRSQRRQGNKEQIREDRN